MSGVSLSEFADQMNKVMPVIIKEFSRHQANKLYKGKITLPQFLMLNFLMVQESTKRFPIPLRKSLKVIAEGDFLDSSGESKMKDLAVFMGVTTAAMTGMVERLVRQGYVVRRYDPQDRRIIKIKLTPRGNTLVNKINAHRDQMIIKTFGRISDKDRQDYLRILLQIRDILSTENAGAK